MTKNISVLGCIAMALFSATMIGCAGDVSDEEDPEIVGAVQQALDLPDLIVQSFTQECLSTGIKQTVVIKNQGAASAPSAVPRFLMVMTGCTGSPCYGASWGPNSFGLAAGATESFSSTTSIPGSGWTCAAWASMNGSWRITADVTGSITESDETNNVSTFPNTF